VGFHRYPVSQRDRQTDTLMHSAQYFATALVAEVTNVPNTVPKKLTRMWANAQLDATLPKYRWRPLFNTANFGWRPLLVCCAVMLPRRKTQWNLQGCPKLPNRSQPLVGRSSPYHEDMWRRYCCLISFFQLSTNALVAKIQPNKVVRWCRDGNFLSPVSPASCMQHISDVHLKFALRPHHLWKYGRHPLCISK